MKSQEFQAIVLAGGKGSRMSDLTHKKSKCFLPIGNYPMVWYSLRLLQNIGFTEVIVVTQEGAKDEMSKLPKQFGLDLQLDIVTFSNNEDLGTADALRLVHSRLKSENIMVVSSDLLVDVNQIRHLTDLHRVHRSSVTALFAPISIDPKQVQVPGPKAKQKTEKDLVGIDKSTGQLCFLSSEADLNETISIKRSLLHEHPCITVHSNLLDAHFYIFEKWVADFVSSDRDFTAIKGELLPFLVRHQFRRQNNDKPDQAIEEETPNPKTATNNHDPVSYIQKDKMAEQAQALSSWNDHTGDMKDAYRNRRLRCYAFLMDRAGTCIRANNLVSYCEVNRQIAQLWPLLVAEREMVINHSTAKIQPKAVIGPECLIGEDTKISDKTTIKSCSIGARCVIEEKVRLTSCVIMNGVTVKSGSNLQGVLICDDVTVEQRCDVKDSIVGHGQVVPAEAKICNEVVYEDDSTMYI